jgi:hypothetical protein
MSSHVSRNLSWPDPAKHGEYLTLLRQIREINPRAEVPSPEDVDCVPKARRALQTLKDQRRATAPSVTQQDHMRAHELYNQFVERVAYAKTKGVIWTDEFPRDSGGYIGDIQRARSELEKAIHYMATTTPRDRELDKRFEEMGEEIAQLKTRVHALEQELSHT